MIDSTFLVQIVLPRISSELTSHEAQSHRAMQGRKNMEARRELGFLREVVYILPE
jgi:hypothetical protein